MLTLPPGGAGRLSAFLWASIAKDAAGRPALIDRGPFAGSLYYEATERYSLGFTCNAWSAAALAAAGVPIDADGVVFAYQVMARARRASP